MALETNTENRQESTNNSGCCEVHGLRVILRADRNPQIIKGAARFMALETNTEDRQESTNN